MPTQEDLERASQLLNDALDQNQLADKELVEHQMTIQELEIKYADNLAKLIRVMSERDCLKEALQKIAKNEYQMSDSCVQTGCTDELWVAVARRALE